MSQIPTARYENVPNSNQLGRKRPRFRSARTKTSQIPISKDENVPDSDEICLVLMRSSAIFRKICEKLRLGQKYAELCGEWIIMRNCLENRKLCDIALTALKCCLCLALSLIFPSARPIELLCRGASKLALIDLNDPLKWNFSTLD